MIPYNNIVTINCELVASVRHSSDITGNLTCLTLSTLKCKDGINREWKQIFMTVVVLFAVN